MNKDLHSPQGAATTQPMQGYKEAGMQIQGVEPAISAMAEFCRFSTGVVDNPTLSSAKVACEMSRDGWLKLFPVRQFLLERHRDVVGDFVQSLLDTTDAATRLLHEDKVRVSPNDMADLQHYVHNMRDRVRLLTSLLVGEDRVRRTLVESTSSLAD